VVAVTTDEGYGGSDEKVVVAAPEKGNCGGDIKM